MRRLVVRGVLAAVGAGLATTWPTVVHGQTPACSAQGAGFSGDCTAAATVGLFTLTGFRFRKTDGTFVSVASSTQTFDAASVSAGAAVGTYASGGTLPPGVYDAVSPLMSVNITVRGSTTGAISCFTKSATPFAGGAGPAENATFTLTIPPGSSGTTSDGVTVTIVDTTPAGLPLTITGSETVSATINFGVDSGVIFTFAGGACNAAQPGFLDVSMTLSTSP